MPAPEDERRREPTADGSEPKGNPEAEPTDPRSTDPSGARFVVIPAPFSHVARDVFSMMGTTRRPMLHPGRPIAQLNHCDRLIDKRHVGPSAWKRDARPSAGSNLRRDI